MPPRPLVEVCVESAAGALAAQEGGADRVELCANLLEGGTTPSAGTIRLARRELRIAMNVIIRPRGGDFCYSDLELEVMKQDIALAKEVGADGVVIGILTAEGDVDVPRTAELIALARPLSVTFHRAFDMARDPYRALEDLIALGVDRVLTSGQESSVVEGLDLIADLVQRAEERIIVMPGGGINERNIARIVAQSGAKEVHFAAPAEVESRMRYRNPRAYMGGALRPPEYALAVTDGAQVRECLRSLSG